MVVLEAKIGVLISHSAMIAAGKHRRMYNQKLQL